MRNLACVLVCSFAALATGAVAATAASDYRVVVPVPGRAAQGISVYLNPAQLPTGTVGQAYPGFEFSSKLQVLHDATFNGTGVSWRVSAGSLPAGLSLTSSGGLVGTPTAGTTTGAQFEVAVTYKKRTAWQTYNLDVQASPTEGGTPAEPDVDNDSPPAPATSTGAETIADGAAELTVTPTSLAFGDVARLIPTEPLTVSVTNVGNAPASVVLSKLSSTEFDVTHNCPVSLEAGDTCQVSTVFTPVGQRAVKSSFVVQLGNKSVTVNLSGTGHHSAAQFDYAPLLVNNIQDLGIVAVGQFRQAKTKITNTSPYYALKLIRSDVGAAPFSAAHDCPDTLSPAQSCTVTYQYRPTVEAVDSRSAYLQLNIASEIRSHQFRARAAGDLTVSSLSAPAALLPGQGTLAISGTGFVPGAKVYFGDIEAVSTFNSGGLLFATVPPVSAPETSLVTVVNPDGAAASAATPFSRVKSMVAFDGAATVNFGSLPVGAASDWVNLNLRNTSYFPNESFTITDRVLSGPFEVDTANSSCKPGYSLPYRWGSCSLRVRFKPTTPGDQAGSVSIVGGTDELSRDLTGQALIWDGTPSGSGTANTDVPYAHTVSGNQHVGGGVMTKYADIYFRNTNPAAQLAAYFKLEKGSVVKLYSVYKTAGGAAQGYPGCSVASTGAQTTLCTADNGAGTYPHLQVRLSMTSAPGPGTYTDSLIVLDTAGKEQFRLPLTLDVVYNVTAELSATAGSSTPVDALVAADAPLGSESFKDVYLRNVGTNGMLQGAAQLMATSSEFYLKSDSLYAMQSTASGIRYCNATLVNTSEVKNCLSDDIAGGTYPHQRIRVYYKPTTEGTLNATLRLTHSGQGVNPLDIPVSVSTGTATHVFSGSPPSAAVTTPSAIRVPANYDVDGSTVVVQKSVYLNKTSSTGNLYGYLQLEGAVAGKLELFHSFIITTNNNSGSICTSDLKLMGPCTGTTTYPHFSNLIRVYPALGAGTHTTKLSYLDANKKEINSVPLTIEVVNDATPVVSGTVTSTVPLTNGRLDLGSATLGSEPGQPSTAVKKMVYVRNTGTIGKLKISRAVIDGGNGAFSLSTGNYPVSLLNQLSQRKICFVKHVSPQEFTDCVTDEPSTHDYKHIGLEVTYAPTAVGVQDAMLNVWHNSTTVPNPLQIPLRGNGVQQVVAGELSASYSSTTTPSGVFASAPGASTTRYVFLFLRNTGSYGAINIEDLSLTGAPNFTFFTSRLHSATGYMGANCGTFSTDKRTVSPCRTDNVDAANSYQHLAVYVACTTTEIGTYTGQLRIKTQGKEHLLPLSCNRPS